MFRVSALHFGLIFVTVLACTPQAMAAPDLEVVIQPIQICNSDGSRCTNPGMELYESGLDEIWGQAGIDVRFLPFDRYYSPADLVVSLSELQESYSNTGALTPSTFFTNAGGKHADPLVLNLWFVEDITGYGGGTILGVSNAHTNYTSYWNYEIIPLNGVVINDCINRSGNTYDGWYNVIGHELGHNLGLEHVDDPTGMFGTASTRPENLMSSYAYGPSSQYNQLTPGQIALARSSQFVHPLVTVPVPGSMLLSLSGLAGYLHLRRRV